MATVSELIAERVSGIRLENIPEDVLCRARHLLLDSVGVGIAASPRDFADTTIRGLQPMGSGNVTVIGRKEKLNESSAAIANGVMIHGHDFDDTHLEAVSHVSASSLAAMISATPSSSKFSYGDLLLGYIIAIEVNARLGMAAGGKFHDKGFHPTGVVGAFGAAVGVGVLQGLSTKQLAHAQGIVGSFASGLFQFLDEGSPTKRLHPGWAANAGLHAVSLAAAGYEGPREIYEGRFGLYKTHIQDSEVPSSDLLRGLGETWEVPNVAVKPFPTCHFTHAFIDIASRMRSEPNFDFDQIEKIEARIHDVPGRVVCEPLENKYAPRSEYDAKFSLPYLVATAAKHGRITFDELNEQSRQNPEILAVTSKVEVHNDPDSLYPHAYSGDLTIRLKDGTTYHEVEKVNRGHASRPLSNEEIVKKFIDCAEPVLGSEEATTIQSVVLTSDLDSPAAEAGAKFGR